MLCFHLVRLHLNQIQTHVFLGASRQTTGRECPFRLHLPEPGSGGQLVYMQIQICSEGDLSPCSSRSRRSPRWRAAARLLRRGPTSRRPPAPPPANAGGAKPGSQAGSAIPGSSQAACCCPGGAQRRHAVSLPAGQLLPQQRPPERCACFDANQLVHPKGHGPRAGPFDSLPRG